MKWPKVPAVTNREQVLLAGDARAKRKRARRPTYMHGWFVATPVFWLLALTHLFHASDWWDGWALPVIYTIALGLWATFCHYLDKYRRYQ